MRRAVVVAAVLATACSGTPPLPRHTSSVPPATQRSIDIPSPSPPIDVVPSSSRGPGGNGSGSGGRPRKDLPGPLIADRSALPPARGSYRYEVITSTTLNGEPVRYRSFVVYRRTRAEREGDRWTQREHVEPEGTTTSETFTYRGGPSNVRQVKRVQHAGGGSITCTYSNPFVVLELPLRAEAVWREREPACEESEPGTRATRDRVRFEVLRRRVVIVDDTKVRCWVVERVTTTPPAKEGGEPRTSTTTVWFAPAYSLIVKQRVVSGANDASYTLLNLEPRRP